MSTWPTACGRMGAVREWMWMPMDLAVFGAGTTVGIGLTCSSTLALEARSVLFHSVLATEIGGAKYRGPFCFWVFDKEERSVRLP